MIRLFVAALLPTPLSDHLLSIMGGISGARWQREDQLHLTLRFIGDVNRHQAGEIADALQGVHLPPLAISLNGVGQFDKQGLINAVWAGIAPAETLRKWHNKIDRALVLAGLPSETRAYLPHVTLARLNRSSGPTASFLNSNAALSSPDFVVDRFQLFESLFTPDGSAYEVLEEYRCL
jgi:2'-5' RNA ligase